MPRPIGEQPPAQPNVVAPRANPPDAELNEELLLSLEEEQRVTLEPHRTSEPKPVTKPRDRYELKAAADAAAKLDPGPPRLFRRPMAVAVEGQPPPLTDEEQATLSYTLAIQQGLIDRDGVGPVFGGIVGGEGTVSSWAAPLERLVEAQRLYRVEQQGGRGFAETRKLLDAFLTETSAALASAEKPLNAIEAAQLHMGQAIAHNALGLTYVATSAGDQSWQRAMEQFELAIIQTLRLETVLATQATDVEPDAVLHLRAQAELWRQMAEENRARCLPEEAAIEVLWELLLWRIDQARAEQAAAEKEQRKADEAIKAHQLRTWVLADQLAKRILGMDGGQASLRRNWESLADEQRGRVGAAMAHAREAFDDYGRRFKGVNSRFPAFFELQALMGTARDDASEVARAVESARAFAASPMKPLEGVPRERARAWAQSVVDRFGH